MKRLALVLVSAALLMGAGCSSDDKSDSSAGKDEGARATQSTPPASDDASSEFCTAFESMARQEGMPEGPGAVIEKLRSVAPPDEAIRPDYELFVAYIDEATRVDRTDAAAIDAFDKRSAEMAEVNERIRVYVTEECGIDTSTP